MSRAEFSKPTKRAALQRSEQKCEATGAIYGLMPGQRCNANLSYGVEFDHIILEANSKDNSLENCAAVCRKCHKFKTNRHDKPLAAKTQRTADKAMGIRRKATMPGGRDSKWKKKISGEVVFR